MPMAKDALKLQVELIEAKNWMARNEYSAPKGFVADKKREIEHLEQALSFCCKEVLLSETEKKKVEKAYEAIIAVRNSRSRASL